MSEPAFAMSNSHMRVDTFDAELRRLGKDYLCHSALPAASASVLFLATFQGQAVLWDMTLSTLSHCREIEGGNIPATVAGEHKLPFIQISEGKQGVFPIRVGLELELIDEPAIKKSIIMVRNYKRLAIGRIVFGSMPT
jgi:hypothetical protein